MARSGSAAPRPEAPASNRNIAIRLRGTLVMAGNITIWRAFGKLSAIFQVGFGTSRRGMRCARETTREMTNEDLDPIRRGGPDGLAGRASAGRRDHGVERPCRCP